MRFRNEFLNAYMEYVDETESPRIFHIWSALSGIAATLGRRVRLPFLDSYIFPNMFVFLVGPPAVKKSTAINLMKNLVQSSTGVRFAPKDTGGQRQGLLAAMHFDLEEDGDELLNSLEIATETASGTLMNGVEQHNAGGIEFDLRDRHSMYVTASELASILGHNNLDMLNFLLEMFDGEDYPYKLKSTEITLKQPLLNLIGGTTPTSISEIMPSAAMGQGFMSRVILVYANEKHGRFPRPRLKEEVREPIKEAYNFIFNNFDGNMEESVSASRLLDELYDYNVAINDPRFVYYIDRRHIHLIKLSMVLTASRLSRVIEPRDVEEAHSILAATELAMSDALGEYGLSPIAASKQRLLEFILAAKSPITMNILWAVMHREMKRIDFTQSLADLVNAGKIALVDTDDGPAYVARESKSRKGKVDDLLEDLVVEDEGENHDRQS